MSWRPGRRARGCRCGGRLHSARYRRKPRRGLPEELRDDREAVERRLAEKPWDISELMRSIFLDYFIGSLLLWKGKKENFESLACEPIYGFQGQGAPEHIVLDGQQRLTAMYYAFMAPNVPAPSRANRFLYFIRADRFMEEAPVGLYIEPTGHGTLARPAKKEFSYESAMRTSGIGH